MSKGLYDKELMIKENNSNYGKDDYRSRNYSGDWTKCWLQKVDKSAIARKESIYERMWELCDEKTEHMPKSVYKFYPLTPNSLKCIESNKVYLNSPENFNDPYDCFICSEQEVFIKTFFINYVINNEYVKKGIITESELEKIKLSYPDPFGTFIPGHHLKTFNSVIGNIILLDADRGDKLSDVRYQAYKEYKNTISAIRNNKIRVSSFSNLNDDVLCRSTEMWGHYAASHTGFCVEYDLESKLSNAKLDSLVRGGMMPCKYSRRPIFISNTLFWKYYNRNRMTENQRIQFEKDILLSFLNKSRSWSYEKEWRLIVPNDVCKMYDNMIDFFPIKTIYLGVKMSSDNREYFYDFAKRKNIHIMDMRCETDAYELEAVKVDVDKYYEWKNIIRQSTITKSNYTFLWNV